MKRISKRGVSEVDKIIGLRIREVRRAGKISQEQLAADVGVTFQMIQKYELGRSRIAVTRLLAISSALEKPAAYFLEGV